MNKIFITLFYFLSFTSILLVFGIYEEEVGKRDWSIHNIGQFEDSLYFKNDETILVHSKILNKVDQQEQQEVLKTTTSHVISLLNLVDGNQKWRQLLPIQEQTFQSLKLNNFDNTYFLTLSDNKIIRYWNKLNGELIWSYDSNNVGESNCYDIDVVSKDGVVRVICKDSILFIKKEKQVLVLSNIKNSNNGVYNIKEGGDNSIIKQLDSNTIYYISNNDNNNNLNLIEFNLHFKPSKSNQVKLSSSSSNSLSINSNNKQIITILSTPLNLDIIYKSNLYSKSLESLLPPSSSSSDAATEAAKIESISTISNNNQFIIKLSNGNNLLVEFNIEKLELELIKNIKGKNLITSKSSNSGKSIYLVCNNDNNQYSLINNNDKLINIPSISKNENGLIEKVETYDNGYILISMSDWSINLFKLDENNNNNNNNNNGIKLLWTRNEALSFILSSEIIDYPLPEISKLAQLQYEFNETDGFFAHFSKRITIQIKDIFGLNKQEQQQQQGQGQVSNDDESIKKVIIISTLSGKVFALNSNKGQLLWSRYYSNFKRESGKMKIVVTKKTIYEKPEIAIIYSIDDHEKPKSIISFVNPLDGKEYSHRIITSRLLHLTVLPQWSDPITHAQMMYWVINYPLDHPSPMVTLYPWNEQIRKSWSTLKNNYFYLIDQEKSRVRGFGIESLADGKHGGIKSIPTWNLQLATPDEKIVASSSMNSHEIIQSPAIILGNRDLLPKYINRNMISIASLNEKSAILTIYLLDSITGEIIKSFKHQHSSSKVSIVQTENSVVYAHFDIVAQTQLLSSIDIFEKNIDWKTESISSFNATSITASTSAGQLSDQLIIKHKTFVFSNGLIKTLSLSITEKGITSKHILVGLKSGQILPIDKKYINARRPYPNEVTPNDAEEQLIPYKPNLQFPPWYYTTYNSTIHGLNSITSVGTDLESTSLLFAYGQPDIFCVLIAPSLPYDILSDQFNHISLIITSITLLILAILAKRYKKSLLLSKKWN